MRDNSTVLWWRRMSTASGACLTFSGWCVTASNAVLVSGGMRSACLRSTQPRFTSTVCLLIHEPQTAQRHTDEPTASRYTMLIIYYSDTVVSDCCVLPVDVDGRDDVVSLSAQSSLGGGRGTRAKLHLPAVVKCARYTHTLKLGYGVPVVATATNHTYNAAITGKVRRRRWYRCGGQ